MNKKTAPRGVTITRAEADKIIIDWNKSGRQHKKIVLAYGGKWYDVRKLNDEQVLAFMSELIGREIKPEEVKEIKI